MTRKNNAAGAIIGNILDQQDNDIDKRIDAVINLLREEIVRVHGSKESNLFFDENVLESFCSKNIVSHNLTVDQMEHAKVVMISELLKEMKENGKKVLFKNALTGWRKKK